MTVIVLKLSFDFSLSAQLVKGSWCFRPVSEASSREAKDAEAQPNATDSYLLELLLVFFRKHHPG